MTWDYIPAENFCDSVRDGTHDTPKPTDSGYKLVTGKHIKDGHIYPSDAYYISADDYSKINERSLVEQWDVLMSMIGTVGEVAVVKEKPDYAIKNIALFKCGGSEIRGKWLSYYLQSPIAKGHMIGNQKGSSQQFLSLKQLRELPVPITNEKTMQRIVEFLSAYDDLIENNQKQIKLLEEAAQRLYKEWFVDFRFLGHETTPIINGLPEGWNKFKFSEKVSIMSGGTPKTDQKEYYGGNIPFFTPKDHNGMFFAYKTTLNITEAGLSNCNSSLYPQNTIIITARGTVGKTVLLAVPMAMNQSCYALKCDELKLPYYLFFSLNAEVQKLKTMSNGGVFDTIIVKTFDNIQIVFPANRIATRFEEKIALVMKQIKLKMQNTMLLTEARDHLLSKLMNGEINV